MPEFTVIHSFRKGTKILGLTVVGGALIITTDRGVYRMAKTTSKPRKIKIDCTKSAQPSTKPPQAIDY